MVGKKSIEHLYDLYKTLKAYAECIDNSQKVEYYIDMQKEVLGLGFEYK